MKKTRESGIELLRIITMIGVMTLHYNERALPVLNPTMVNYYMLHFSESIYICAVDLFMLISGYYLCTSQKRNVCKVIELIVQVLVIRYAFYLLSCFIGGHMPSYRLLIVKLIPHNYFVILYAAVYIISPYINVIFKKLDTRQWRIFILIIIMIFAVWPTIWDFIGEVRGQYIDNISTIGKYGSGEGFTIVTFILMYIIGSFIRLNKIDEKFTNKPKLILSYAACVALIFITSLINKRLGSIKLCSAWEYCNPLVMLEAVVLFILFKNIHFTDKKVNSLAKAAFTCFLVHSKVLGHFKIDSFAVKPWYIVVIHWLITVTVLYLTSYIIFNIYNFITKPIFSKIDKAFNKIGIIIQI